MNDDVPQKYKTIGIVQLVAGLCNFFFGWGIAWGIWSVGATICTAATLGMCPFTYLLYFCGFAGFLVGPLGIAEAIIGALILTNPPSVKGLISFLPMIQVPAILLGDLISPIAGLVSFFMARDPEVAGYLQG